MEAWRRRGLSPEAVKWLLINGVHFHMRMGKGIEIVPVLVVIGLMETGQKLVLSLQSADKEASTSWREFFKPGNGRGKDF